MNDIQILSEIEQKLNIKFKKISNARRLFFDLAPQEASYAVNSDNNIVGIKIKGYQIENIPVQISNLSVVNIINFSNNNIKNLSVLSKLYSLTALNLSQNKISDVSTLNNLINLKWLNVQFNTIKDFLPISLNVKKISKLYVDNNSITDLSFVSEFHLLRELSASNNRIKDIEPIKKMTALKSINFSNNLITDISPLRKLLKLEDVNIAYNKISEIPDLSELQPSSIFNISYNNIKSKQQFEDLKCGIFATGNPLQDVYVFTEPQEGVLNVDWLADISSNIIEQLVTERGSMLGIFGKWGRGKTFFWNVLKKRLKNKDFEIVEFLAWKYHDTPASWAYLYEAFAQKFFHRPERRFSFDWIRYAVKLFYTSIIREPIVSIVRIVVGILFPIIIFFGLKEYLEPLQAEWELIQNLSYLGFWGTYFTVVFYYFSKVYSLNMPNIFKRMSSKNFENLLGMQASIEKELIFLMERWGKKVVLFVDDLDRCSEDRILEVIDSLRIMTENDKISKNLTIVAAIDERILKRVIRNKYSEMVEKNKNSEENEMLDALTREYLDKLFIFGIKLSSLNDQEKVDIFDNYTAGIENLMAGIPAKIFIKKPYNVEQIVTANDFEFIREYLKKVNEITPRQIRIVYNKYLLAKEILKVKLQVSELSSVQKETITAMIMWFSFEVKVETIKSFIDFENLTDEKQISRNIFEKEFINTPEDWQTFVDVIRQTVPY